MARGGINKALVAKARDSLLARGLKPSIDTVRVELGNTGSKTTIQRYLKELAGDGNVIHKAATLSDELSALITQVADRLREEAKASVLADREILLKQQQDYQAQRQQVLERVRQLQTAHAELIDELKGLRQQEKSLQSQLQDSEIERNRLAEAAQGLQRLLDERAGQLQSLEDKHRNARDALEHYRSSHQELRTQEVQRSDALALQLRSEIRMLQSTLQDKQNEISTLYRDNERLLGENRAQSQQLYEEHKSNLSIQQDQERLRIALQAEKTKVAKFQQSLKQHITEHRACKKRIQVMATEMEQLQSSLGNAAPKLFGTVTT